MLDYSDWMQGMGSSNARWGKGNCPLSGRAAPHQEIFHFSWGALMLTIIYVILMKVNRPDDLLDFALLGRSDSSMKTPNFSISLNKNLKSVNFFQ